MDDNLVEGEESFFGNLRNPVGPITLSPDRATVTIVDDPADSELL